MACSASASGPTDTTSGPARPRPLRQPGISGELNSRVREINRLTSRLAPERENGQRLAGYAELGITVQCFLTFGCQPGRAGIVVARTSLRLCAGLCASTARNAGRLQEQQDDWKITKSGLLPGVPMFIASLKPSGADLQPAPNSLPRRPVQVGRLSATQIWSRSVRQTAGRAGGVSFGPAPGGANPALRFQFVRPSGSGEIPRTLLRSKIGGAA